MLRNPRVGQLVFIDYDNEGFEKLAVVIRVVDITHGQMARVRHLQGVTEDVWVDFLFEVMETFAGRIMIDWRNGVGSDPV